MAIGDAYYDDIVGGQDPSAGLLEGLKKKLGTKGLKGGMAQLVGWMALNRLLQEPGKIGEANVQREAIRAQAEGITPERLYYEASLPQAQEEEAMARQALLSHMSGGILGPSMGLARGEKMIGG